MNIFFLDKDPVTSAEAMTDKHVVKMILESAQMLSTAHRMLDGEETIMVKNNRQRKYWYHPKYDDILYKATHYNHPSNVWVRESIHNYMWLYIHFCALCNEYNTRYGKHHKTETLLRQLLSHFPNNIPNVPMTKVKIAITDNKWHTDDPIQSYRNYYIGEKLHLDSDKKRFYSILQINN